MLQWACSLCCHTEGPSQAWPCVLRVSWLFCSLPVFPPVPFSPRITNSEQEGWGYSAGSLLPLPAPAADLLLMSKVAWGCRLPRGGSSPCSVALISCGNCMSSLACGCCYLFPCFSLEKLLFSSTAVYASILLPGRGRMKWHVVLLLCDGRWRQRRSTAERDCLFPLRISHPRYENREFVAEANGQEMRRE